MSTCICPSEAAPLSNATTVPDTPPEIDHVPEPLMRPNHRGDFARLIPSSARARLAFSNLVDRIREDPIRLPHARQYVHYEELDSPMSESEPSNAEAESEYHGRSHLRWRGYWRLNLDIPPARPHIGWVVGSSRSTLKDDDVDILLTSTPGEYGIGGRHVRLTLHKRNGSLVLVADNHTATLNGTDRVTHSSRVIPSRSAVSIRELSYIIEFTDLDRTTFVAQLAALGISHAAPSGTQLLTPTPQGSTNTLGGYVMYPVEVGGVAGAVSYGHEIVTGDEVAVKKLRRTRRNYQEIANEIRLLQKLHHPNICTLRSVHYASAETPPYAFRPEQCDEVLLFLTPVATNTLASYRDVPLQPAEKETIFQQCLSAVSYLHSEGLMHRDIKPANIALNTIPTIHAFLLDFGHAIEASHSADHFAGTIPYLAPEVIALKQRRSSTPYTAACDIWSLGLSLLEVFFRIPVRWQAVTESEHRRFVDRVDALRATVPMASAEVDCLLGMVAWSADERPRSSKACAQLEQLVGGAKGDYRVAGGDRREAEWEEPGRKRRELAKFSRQIVLDNR